MDPDGGAAEFLAEVERLEARCGYRPQREGGELRCVLPIGHEGCCSDGVATAWASPAQLSSLSDTVSGAFECAKLKLDHTTFELCAMLRVAAIDVANESTLVRLRDTLIKYEPDRCWRCGSLLAENEKEREVHLCGFHLRGAGGV